MGLNTSEKKTKHAIGFGTPPSQLTQLAHVLPHAVSPSLVTLKLRTWPLRTCPFRSHPGGRTLLGGVRPIPGVTDRDGEGQNPPPGCKLHRPNISHFEEPRQLDREGRTMTPCRCHADMGWGALAEAQVDLHSGLVANQKITCDIRKAEHVSVYKNPHRSNMHSRSTAFIRRSQPGDSHLSQ